jgi:hypothetical protein
VDRAWAERVVRESVARYLCQIVDSKSEDFWIWESDHVLCPGLLVPSVRAGHLRPRCPSIDLRVPLYLSKKVKMAREDMGPLAQLADDCTDRAEALAQCFTGAKNLDKRGCGGAAAALWASMAKCPSEVCELIAVHAQLVLPRDGHG